MPMDLLTLGTGILSFVIFLIIQVISFRWLRPEEILKSLRLCILAIALLPVILMAIFFGAKVAVAPLSAWLVAALVALLISGLTSFVYVLCIFGPYETSVRMRLVREIAKGGTRGITLEELLSRYSPETIMKIRLRRLTGSGDVIEKDGRYQAGGRANFFFAFDIIANSIKRWIGR